MRILILNWRDIDHPLAGGAELSLFEHAKFWQKKGAEITWISSQFPNGKKIDHIEGMTIIRHGSYYTVHLRTCLLYMRNKLGTFDVVIDSFHFIPFFSPLYIKNTKKIALINEIAGSIWFKNLPLPFSFIGYIVEPWFFQFYKNTPFFTASKSTYNELQQVGIPKKNITIIHHGVTIPGYSIEKKNLKKPVLIFLNRISFDKGIEDVLKAYLMLKNKIPTLSLWIGGKEERKNILEELVTKTFRTKNMKKIGIEYFGFVSETKKFALFQKASLLIHPSHKEGWGLTVIEAASQGTPTIGYDVAGLRDSIIHGKTGILTKISPQALYDGIIMLLSDEKKFSTISKHAYAWSKEFSWEKSTQESWRLIEKVIERKRYK